MRAVSEDLNQALLQGFGFVIIGSIQASKLIVSEVISLID